MILCSLGDIRDAGAAWSALPAEEKETYKERARVESNGEGSEESKLLRRTKLLKQLTDQVGCNGSPGLL